MSNKDSELYSLPRDRSESNRLNGQHEVYKANAGFLLHPRIASNLPEKVDIAEVGTGTGAWLRDLASQSPSSWTYTGFDISNAQFPQGPQETGPCRFATLNILEPIPNEYKAQFDVVHLRLLTCGLVGADWTTASRNVFALLKPGGWIQWHESDFRRIQIVQNTSSASTAATRQLIDIALDGCATEGKMLDDVRQLAQTLRSNEFEACEQFIFSSDRVAETREALNMIQNGAVSALARFAVKAGTVTGWTAEQVDDLAQRSKAEVDDLKAYFRWDMYIVTGRKPLG